MKTPIRHKWIGRLLLLAVLVLPLGRAEAFEDGVVETYKKATALFDDTARVEAVLPLTVKTVPVSERYRGRLFYTETRKDKLERFSCSKCHNNQPVPVAQSAEMAHGTIALDHGSEDRPLSCYTCHSKDERDYLVTEQGIKVDMDHSYQMCGQCHFRQKKDWVGGAHGKRIANWAGQRVVKNCTACHDPHSPRFKKRWPATYSVPLSKSK
ncbi:MAG: hypothetical protein PVG35_06875 [Desulfobacterales bacterium]